MLTRQGGRSGVDRCRLENVNSHSLGIVGIDPQTRRRTNAIIIPKNSPIPCHVARVFQTAKANQRSVKVTVVEGESHRPEECIALGECVVRDLPPGLPKGTPIQVEYSYAANGRISVSARVRRIAAVGARRDRAPAAAGLGGPGRLAGPPANRSAASSGAIDPGDRGAVLRRLDALYMQVGRAAAQQELPPALKRSQQAAADSLAALERARRPWRDAQSAVQSAAGRGEAMRLGSDLARTKTACEQAQTQADFALLVLGRDCVTADSYPPAVHGCRDEIQRLKPLAGQ